MVKKYQDTKQARSFLRPAFEATLSAVELTDKIVAKSSAIVKETSISAFENFSANSVMIMSSERDKGIAYLERWIEKNVVGYLKICDPYFGPADLEILQVILKINPIARSYSYSIKRQVQDFLAVPRISPSELIGGFLSQTRSRRIRKLCWLELERGESFQFMIDGG